MVSLDKLKKLTSGQQKALHQNVVKFLRDHLLEMKELSLVDEALLVGYFEKTTQLSGLFQKRTPDQSLIDELYTIMVAAEKKIHEEETIEVLAELIRIFTMLYQEMKNVDESLKLIHSLQNQKVKVVEFEEISDDVTNIR